MVPPEHSHKIKERNGRQGEKSHRDVKSMQAEQRIIRRTEQIRVYREAVMEDQVNPFAGGPEPSIYAYAKTNVYRNLYRIK